MGNALTSSVHSTCSRDHPHCPHPIPTAHLCIPGHFIVHRCFCRILVYVRNICSLGCTHTPLRDSAPLRGLLPCSHPVPALALQHFLGSLPLCRWFQPLHLLWELGTHSKKWLCWQGLGTHQAAAESLAGKAVPRKAAPCIALCLCDVACLEKQH